MAGPGQPFGPRTVAVRRCLLAVSVLHDLDLTWADDEPGADRSAFPDVTIDDPTPLTVPGHRLAALVEDCAPDGEVGIDRVARWLLLRRSLHHLPVPLLLDALRVIGLPAGHVTHPGPAWIRSTVPGGAVTLGLGLLPDVAPGALPASLSAGGSDLLGGAGPVAAVAAPAPVPLPPGLLEEIGVDPEPAWVAGLRRLEELGTLAAARRRRRPRDPLRPLAEADVVTLLGSRRFRFALAGESTAGLAGLVLPMLTRGWVSSSAIDPAFGPAAAAATSPDQRGFPRPLLVTEYEVVQVPEGGHPLRYLGGQKQRSAFS